MDYFASIIGYDATKEELRRIAHTLKNAGHYEKLGIEAPHGLILYGPAGTGKTLMAECVVNASGRPAYVCRRNESNDTFIDKMKGVFKDAENNAPSIVVLDDMDKFANSDYDHRDAPEFVAVQSCIDNVRGKDVFVLATANENIKNLPKSLLRPGRFDRQICVGVPKGDDAVRIIEKYLSNKPVAKDIDPAVIASMLAGHSCATLETVVNEAGIIAVYACSESITTGHMIEAAMRAVYHVPAECLYDTDPVDLESQTTKAFVVWHEAGHAVMEELLMPGSVALVSARSKSEKNSHNGFTVKNWKEPSNSFQAEIFDVLVSLSGRAAIDIVYGLPDTGAKDDIARAYQGISGLLGDECVRGLWLHHPDYDYMSEDQYDDSDETRYARQIAASQALEDYYGKAKRTLIKNRAFLDKLAHALAEKSYLTAKEIAELKQGLVLEAPEA